MNTSLTTANPRLAFRMKPELKERIEEAASLLGLDLTDFVLSTGHTLDNFLKRHALENDRRGFGTASVVPPKRWVISFGAPFRRRAMTLSAIPPC